MNNRNQQQGQGATPNHQACAPCKLQRKKCNETCELAPYFPASRYYEFLNAHKIYGTSNIQKIIAMVKPEERQAAAESLLIEANIRRSDPTNGCYGVVRRLISEKESLEKELVIVNQELAKYKEKEKLDLQRNQSKEEDLQHDQSKNRVISSEPPLPEKAPEVMAEVKKPEQGYVYYSNSGDGEEKAFEIGLIAPVLESDEDESAPACFSGPGESSTAAASKGKEKQP